MPINSSPLKVGNLLIYKGAALFRQKISQAFRHLNIYYAADEADLMERARLLEPQWIFIELGDPLSTALKEGQAYPQLQSQLIFLSAQGEMVAAANLETALKSSPCMQEACELASLMIQEAEAETEYQKLGEEYFPSPPFVQFWGTRGSNPVSGRKYVQFGGNTVCLEVRFDEQCIIFDAGTGIRELGHALVQSKKVEEIHLFLSHTHWDHIMGLPFFAPLYDKYFTIHIYGATKGERTIEQQLRRMFDSDFFPIGLDDFQANLFFHPLQAGRSIQLGTSTVSSHLCNHPGTTLCFKVETLERTIGYAPDNEILKGYHGQPDELTVEDFSNLDQSLLHFFASCDLFIHEAPYTQQEYLSRVGWGHSSMSNLAAFIKHSQIKEWAIIHHDPNDDDERLREKLRLQKEILKECQIHCPVIMAWDGLIIPL